MEKDFFEVDITDDEIDFVELFFVLRSHIIAIISTAAIGAIIALLVTMFVMKPIYKSSSMIYIFSKTTTLTSAIDLQIGSQLTVDFKILGTSRPVIEKVIEGLGLDTDYETLVKTVEIENPKDSRIIRITVSNQDPRLACDIANELAEMLAARVAEVIDTTKPSSVENAVPALKPSSPSKIKNTALGGILGMLIVIGIILVRYYSDMSLRSEEDVTKYLGLATLAEFPYEKSIEGEQQNSTKNKKSKKRRT